MGKPSVRVRLNLRHWRDGSFGRRSARSRRHYLGECLSSSRGITRQQVGDALFAERYDELRPRESISGTTLGNDGRFGSVERLDFVWPYYGISLRHNSESVAEFQPIDNAHLCSRYVPRTGLNGLVRIDVAKSAYHQQSQTEIASDNPCSRHLSVPLIELRVTGRNVRRIG